SALLCTPAYLGEAGEIGIVIFFAQGERAGCGAPAHPDIRRLVFGSGWRIQMALLHAVLSRPVERALQMRISQVISCYGDCHRIVFPVFAEEERRSMIFGKVSRCGLLAEGPCSKCEKKHPTLEVSHRRCR